MLKIQMLEQIVTSDSVAEQQKQEEHEQHQQQQHQEEQNGYDIWVVNVNIQDILRKIISTEVLRGAGIALQSYTFL